MPAELFFYPDKKIFLIFFKKPIDNVFQMVYNKHVSKIQKTGIKPKQTKDQTAESPQHKGRTNYYNKKGELSC